jgi:hypothetical protein
LNRINPLLHLDATLASFPFACGIFRYCLAYALLPFSIYQTQISFFHSFHCVLAHAVRPGSHAPGFEYPFCVFISESWKACSASNTLGLSPSELYSSQVINLNSSLKSSAPAVGWKTRYASHFRSNSFIPLEKPFSFASSEPFKFREESLLSWVYDLSGFPPV